LVKEITVDIKNPEILILSLTLVLFFLMSFVLISKSPIAFGDEGFHTRIAQYMGEEKDYPVWTPIYGSPLKKGGFFGPPIFHLLEGSFGLLGYSEIILKFLIPLIGIILIGFSTFALGKKLFDTWTALIAAIITVSVPSLVTYSVLLYRDVLFTLYSSIFVLTAILAIKTNDKKYWLVSGVFCAFTFLTKTPGYTAPFFVGILFLYQLIKQKNFAKTFKQFLPIIIIFFLITGTFFLRNLAYYKTPACNFPMLYSDNCVINEGYEDEIQYEGRTHETGTESSAFRIGLTSFFDFAYGNIWFIPLTFTCGLFLLFLRKTQVDILLVLAILSFLPVMYIAFPGRAEDTSRYLLALVPLICLVSANFIREAYERLIKNKNMIWAGIAVFFIADLLVLKNYFPSVSVFSISLSLIFAILLFGLVPYFAFTKKTKQALVISIALFVILFSFTNIYTKLNVMKQVKQFSPYFFEACEWIKANTAEDARLGGVVWAGATGYNCQREVGGGGADVTWSRNMSLVMSILHQQGSTHIFIQKFSITWADEKLTEKYSISWIDWMESNPKRFVKVYENGPTIEQCKQVGGCDGAILYELNYTDVEFVDLG